MKKAIALFTLPLIAFGASAQSALDGGALMKQDIKGTARFMSMGGAFGALGGDMSTLSYNPAGIGVYRHSEIGLTMDFDIQNSSTDFNGNKNEVNHFKFLINNGGYIGSFNMNSDVMPNFNWGVTYNRKASFNRRFTGTAYNLGNSLSNYIAGVANNSGVLQDDITGPYDPYNSNSNQAPWLTILGYDSYYISPNSTDPNNPDWVGQYVSGTTGIGTVTNIEKGGIDEYNIALGGNIKNIVYWGMDFGITSLDYIRQTYWGESLDNASVDLGTGYQTVGADWDLYNQYRVKGTGFNYKLGVIIKPIQELRIGFAMHTPTWYGLTEYYYADTSYAYYDNNGDRITYNSDGENIGSGAQTNDGYEGVNDFSFRTPWRFIGSIAGVIGNSLIVSADIDWTGMQYTHFSTPKYNNYWYDDDYWYWDAPAKMPTKSSSSDPYYYTNSDVKDYYKTSTTVRIGAEYRVLPQFSVRAGYAYTTSPVKESAKNGSDIVYTSDPNPSYEFDNDINYVSCGLGYRYKSFYADLAYCYRVAKSEWHAYSPGIGDNDYSGSKNGGPVAKVTSTDNQLVLSMGFRF